MAGVMALFGTSELSALDWVLGGVAGLAAYAAGLLVVREVRLDEVRALVAWVRRALAS
jgi:hypothetical protein